MDRIELDIGGFALGFCFEVGELKAEHAFNGLALAIKTRAACRKEFTSGETFAILVAAAGPSPRSR